ncbi:MAG: MspI family type II restriction endonuclease [Bacteroidota bacterium]
MSKNAFSETNQRKALAGAAFTTFIERELDALAESGIIKSVKKKQNFKHTGYAYEKQYRADFVIETQDDKFIIVRNTTSYRQDRIKTSFYDLQGIGQHAEFAKDIIASVFVVPDAELPKIESLKKSIEEKKQYSPASHVLILSEFITFLEEYAYEMETQLEKAKQVLTAEVKGSLLGKRGNQFEKELANKLSSKNNLKACKLKHLASSSLFYKIISRILQDRQMDFEEIVRIKATNTVPLLKSGGNPKTDLIVTFETFSEQDFVETISLKHTTKNRVSCHDYTADVFINVLRCAGSKLAEYFTIFQNFPTYSAFNEHLPEGYSEDEFSALLSNYQTALMEWALRGKHDYQNLTRPKVQVSNYLLITNGRKSVFYRMEEYISLLLERTKLKFGVPFSWTYPSKQRGKRIQLKVPVLFD